MSSAIAFVFPSRFRRDVIFCTDLHFSLLLLPTCLAFFGLFNRVDSSLPYCLLLFCLLFCLHCILIIFFIFPSIFFAALLDLSNESLRLGDRFCWCLKPPAFRTDADFSQQPQLSSR
jgi:hypothetical protein